MNDREVLRYAGFMGHPFAVTRAHSKDPESRDTAGEFNTREQALKYAGEVPEGRAFRRKAKGGYVQIYGKRHEEAA